MKSSISKYVAALIVMFSIALPTYANQAQVVEAKINAVGSNQYRIDVTLRHADTGWDHYANAWLVYDEKGNLLGERILHHPHVNEQPFTRSLTLTIPARVKIITIRAKDSVHGLNEQAFELAMPK